MFLMICLADPAVRNQLRLDTDAGDRLNQSASFVRTIERRQAMKRACEEIMLDLDPLEAGVTIARAIMFGRVEDAVYRRHSVPSTLAG